MVFASTKTYLDFEKALGMPGIIFLYGAVGVFGWLFFYFLLPETENRTLEDIEIHFSTQSITNIRIKRVTEELAANAIKKKEDDMEGGGGGDKRKVAGGVDNAAYLEI